MCEHLDMQNSIQIRVAGEGDVAAMSECRLKDVGGVDERMAAYFRGEHHPHQALAPRVGFVAELGGRVIGYVAGHLSTRHGLEGEVQYLFVTSQLRRQGIGARLVHRLAEWFCERGAKRICVGVDADSPAAMPFYRAMGARPLSAEKPFWYVWDDAGAILNFTSR